MKQNDIANKLTSILPNRPQASAPGMSHREQLVADTASSISSTRNAKELARQKAKEKQALKELRAKAEEDKARAKRVAETLGVDESFVPDGISEERAAAIKDHEEKLEVIEAIEAEAVSPFDVRNLPPSAQGNQTMLNAALRLQGTSRPEITKLMTALNINLSVQLTKQDTANLLACLLTCNETQLAALYNNPKVPMAIKIIIRRMQDDCSVGNTETVERLWDRVFGKGPMQLDLPAAQQLQTGIIPNVPISREAYIVLRDTIIK